MKFAFDHRTWALALVIASISQPARARDVVLIRHQGQESRALLIQDILEKRFNIPPRLISVQEHASPCTPQTLAVFHLCVDATGEMLFAHIKPDVLERTLKVFVELKKDRKAEAEIEKRK